MGELAKLLLAWFSNPLRALGALLITSCLTVLLSRYQPFADAMKDPFWRWPLLVLMLSSAGLATYPLEHGWKWADSRRRKSALARAIIVRLEHLTPSEKHVLSQYLQEVTTVVHWNRAGGVVDALAHDGILSLLVSDTDQNSLTPDVYRINEIAWKHLNLHPELVDLVELEKSERPVTPPPA